MPWPQALEYTIAAAPGLRAAAAQGFVHRDVKPSNLMLDREAGIKVLDFGLVRSSVISFLHHEQRVVFRLSRLSWSSLAIPLLYAGLALAILVAYLAGFMLVAFHPRRLALHDIVAGTQVCFKSPPPAAAHVIDAVRATSLGRKSR